MPKVLLAGKVNIGQAVILKHLVNAGYDVIVAKDSEGLNGIDIESISLNEVLEIYPLKCKTDEPYIPNNGPKRHHAKPRTQKSYFGRG